jgi:protein gp37
MSDRTGIGWTNATWNPVTGCSHVSPGCDHCYAETLSLLRGWSTKPWTKQNAAVNVVLHPGRLDQPLRWRKPKMVFVNSMSDLFHERIPDAFIDQVFAIMGLASQHTFQILTKRPERMLAYMSGLQQPEGLDRLDAARLDTNLQFPFHDCAISGWGSGWTNVWLGVSIEDQRRADERIPRLLQTPAAVRFISAEPLLGPVDLDGYISDAPHGSHDLAIAESESGAYLYGDGLDWVIVGGESGPGYRPMELGWLRQLVEQCVAEAVPVFVKQDSRMKPGSKGRIPNDLWARKEFPSPQVAA